MRISRRQGVTDVGASPRGCPVFRVGADRHVCPDDSAGAAACRAGLLRIAREAAHGREEGAAARTILGRHIGLPLRRGTIGRADPAPTPTGHPQGDAPTGNMQSSWAGTRPTPTGKSRSFSVL